MALPIRGLNGTDDISLWRAVRQAMQDEGSPSAAAVFAATAPLALHYPKPIRDHILPLIARNNDQGRRNRRRRPACWQIARTTPVWPTHAL